VKAQVVVADSFHLKPLIRAHQFAGRYQVLCVKQDGVTLYEGDKDRLDPVELKNVPRTITEALGEELTERTRSSHTFRAQSTGHQAVPSKNRIGAVGGMQSKKDEDDIDIERSLRAVDKAIWENHSRESGLPLILCAIDKYQGLFQKISHNPNLAREGIALHPERMPIERLHQEAWRIIEPYYKQQLDKIIDEFN